jgi:uncharacterized protein (TIGR03067 family)
MRIRVLLALAAGLLLAAEPLTGGEDRSDADALQGTWQVLSQEIAGRTTARPKDMKWVVQGDTISLLLGKRGGALRMTFRVDATKSPKQINIDGPKKAISFGIYKIEGDELTVCMGVSQPSPTYDKEAKGDEATRPATLSPEAGTVIVLRRVKE